mmetsp:Transcript_30122/g.38684  ORF Transcript_30122/g.38684 Transcript_30122/m.38684 type:complete len:239 (+) Transcript_30122:147-863(+)
MSGGTKPKLGIIPSRHCYLENIILNESLVGNISGFQTGKRISTMGISDVCASGHLSLLLSENFESQISIDSFILAVQNGNLKMVEWFCSENFNFLRLFKTDPLDNLDDCAARGHLSTIEWFDSHRSDLCKFTTWAIDGASRNGHLKMVEWLHHHRLEGCTTFAMDGAAQHGHLHVLEWLHKNRCEGCTAHALDNAAQEGHLSVVRWLLRHRDEGSRISALNKAAVRGHMDVIDLLIST